MERELLTQKKYVDTYDNTYVLSIYTHWSKSYNAYVTFPENHSIFKYVKDGIFDEILKICREVSGDSLVFVKHDTAGYLLNKPFNDCFDILIKTIERLNIFFEKKLHWRRCKISSSQA